MPFLEQDQTRLYYEISGDGFPVLLLAPGGMRSAIPFWENMPWNPIDRLKNDFRVIAMDQRNAGQSTADVGPSDGWDSYTTDQLDLLDHLGAERCHLVGCCIGGSFIANFLMRAPERVASAVLIQPIGSTVENQPAFSELFDGWAAELKPNQPQVPDSSWSTYKNNMFGGDFMYCATREDIQGLTTPMLVLMGNDMYHPEETSREVARLAPAAELIENWKEPETAEEGAKRVAEFLRQHSPS